jgi:hypothetical protein
MLTVIDDRDRMEREQLAVCDPFQLAAPCWRNRVFYQLPPETVEITIEERNRMPLKVVEYNEAPRRLKGGTGPSSKTEYTEVMQAIRDPKNKGKAFIVTMTEAEWKDVKKPEIVFAMSLRRYFTVEKVNWTAYQSGKNEVTVRQMSKAELDAKTQKK